MQLKYAVASIVLALVTYTAVQGTTIVVARSASEIVIGADSKVTDAYGNQLNRRACKIFQVGNLFVAIEGLEIDRRTGFNVSEIARKALLSRPTAITEEKVSNLTGALVSKLFTELAHVREHEKDTYRLKIEGGRTFLSIIVAGFERGRPLVFVRNFKAVPIDPRRMGITVIPDDCVERCEGEVVTRFLGETEAIDGLPEDDPGFWRRGLVDGVRRLVETEITARSEYVGPPIDILRIDRNGAQWVQKKAECSDAKGQRKQRVRVSSRL